MILVTLTQLTAQVRKRADIENSTAFIPDADITDYINRAIARVHGLLAKSGEPYYRTLFQWTAASAQQTYYTTAATGVPAGTAVLPTDIFLVAGVDTLVQSSRWINCERANFERRNDYQAADWFWPVMTSLYDVAGSGATTSIYLQPPPPGAQQFRVWYFPNPVQLAAGGDTWDSANRWDAYVISYAAKYCAEKDENYELCARLDLEINEMEGHIKFEAASRVSGQAPKIRRKRYRRGGWPWGSPGGIP